MMTNSMKMVAVQKVKLIQSFQRNESYPKRIIKINDDSIKIDLMQRNFLDF